MRMDFLSDTTGSFSGGTSTSGNYGISRNLILSDVIKTIVPVDQSFSSTQTGMVSRFTIPALQTITGFAYANVFFSKAVTPPGIDDIPNLQMLPSKNSFDYYVGTVWAQTGTGAWVQTPGVNGFDTAYIRLCAGPAQCLQDLSVPLN